MTPMQNFLRYAQDFEKTYDDDDWSRLGPHFAADAAYEVRGSALACRLDGSKAIFAGLKKSLDGFDRRMPKRTLAVEGDVVEDGDTVSIGWAATYQPDGAEPLVLRGRSTARYRGDEIVELVDAYPPGMDEEARAWVMRYLPGASVAYV